MARPERMNRTLEEYLRCFVGPLQDDWDIHLANAEFAINSTVNSSIGMSPFEADLGFIPRNPLAMIVVASGAPRSQPGVTFREKQLAILLRCQEAISQVQERMKDTFDRNRVEQTFNVGDRVYLSTQYLDPRHSGLPNSSKLGPKWIGPYSIVRKVHNHAYELNIQSGNRLHPVFNTSSLKPYRAPSRLSRPHDVVLADGSVGQLVLGISGKRRRKREVQYLVQWVGEVKKTWEPVENLAQVPDLIAEYEAQLQSRRNKRSRS